MNEETPLLRGVSVHNCPTCHGKGRIRRTTCHDCQGRRVYIIKDGRILPPPQKSGLGRPPDPHEIN